MHALDVMKEVGKTWQTLAKEKRDQFEAKANLDKIRYNQEIKVFEAEVKNMKYDSESSPLEKTKNVNKFSKNGNKVYKNPSENITRNRQTKKTGKGKANIKASNKPKRPLSAYIFFSQEVCLLLFIYI